MLLEAVGGLMRTAVLALLMVVHLLSCTGMGASAHHHFPASAGASDSAPQHPEAAPDCDVTAVPSTVDLPTPDPDVSREAPEARPSTPVAIAAAPSRLLPARTVLCVWRV